MTTLLFCCALALNTAQRAPGNPRPGPPPALAPPTQDVIVFLSDRDAADGDLYRMDHQGGHIQRLTASVGAEKRLAVNSLGTQIAFFRSVPFGQGTSGLYIVKADGTGEKLLRPMADCGSIAFSPDGTRLAFIDVSAPPRNEIYFIKVDGSGLTQFTSGAVANPTGLSWSRDASTLAFVRYNPSPAVFFVPTAGGQAVKVVDGEEPAFSFNGTRLMYSRTITGRKGVYWSDLRSGGEHQLLDGYNIGPAVFYIDGYSVVFSALRPKAQVFFMDPNLQIRNLSNNQFSDSAPAVPGS